MTRLRTELENSFREICKEFHSLLYSLQNEMNRSTVFSQKSQNLLNNLYLCCSRASQSLIFMIGKMNDLHAKLNLNFYKIQKDMCVF